MVLILLFGLLMMNQKNYFSKNTKGFMANLSNTVIKQRTPKAEYYML